MPHNVAADLQIDLACIDWTGRPQPDRCGLDKDTALPLPTEWCLVGGLPRLSLHRSFLARASFPMWPMPRSVSQQQRSGFQVLHNRQRSKRDGRSTRYACDLFGRVTRADISCLAMFSAYRDRVVSRLYRVATVELERVTFHGSSRRGRSPDFSRNLLARGRALGIHPGKGCGLIHVSPQVQPYSQVPCQHSRQCSHQCLPQQPSQRYLLCLESHSLHNSLNFFHAISPDEPVTFSLIFAYAPPTQGGLAR